MRLSRILCVLLVVALGSNVVQANELEAYKNQIRQMVNEHEDEWRSGYIQDFNNMDTDSDGCVTFTELDNYIHQSRKENLEMFVYIDDNEDDCITKQEMSQFVEQTIATIKYH